MKTILNILACILIYGGGAATGFVAARAYRNTQIVKLVPVQAPIPSQKEIQQRLTDLGKARYDPGKIDGVIGKDSRAAWDNLIKDRFAKRAIEAEKPWKQ